MPTTSATSTDGVFMDAELAGSRTRGLTSEELMGVAPPDFRAAVQKIGSDDPAESRRQLSTQRDARVQCIDPPDSDTCPFPPAGPPTISGTWSPSLDP